MMYYIYHSLSPDPRSHLLKYVDHYTSDVFLLQVMQFKTPSVINASAPSHTSAFLLSLLTQGSAVNCFRHLDESVTRPFPYQGACFSVRQTDSLSYLPWLLLLITAVHGGVIFSCTFWTVAGGASAIRGFCILGVMLLCCCQ